MPPKTLALVLLVLLAISALAVVVARARAGNEAQPPPRETLAEIRRRVAPTLAAELAKAGLKPGKPLFLRIFKESREVEAWLEPQPGLPWTLFKTYPVKTWGGGTLGPKLKEGDGQAPEGYYTVAASQMNPNSKYHLAFNLGYPNAYDTAQGRTGSFIMMHGKAASIGCFAMGDPGIEEIYLLAEAALAAPGASFSAHAFPFRMTPERLAREAAAAAPSPWLAFWKESLLPGWRAFEETKRPPAVTVEGKAYVVRPQPVAGASSPR